ncbi:hypothetical protein JQX13_22885 [Archangium violaceum]|uniref:hypothetical protein n=1 Tax=Archangium violaceum TaxID=83451 RepID=UPI00193C3E8E|nr:hypothetical protein [Archangium violaceum]QRK12623.1 hypothetical protein JQX13_22885 [Archangium violaceum]
MKHPSLEELVAKFEAAKAAGKDVRGNPEQLRLHRELAETCPAFTHNLLYLAWLQQSIDQPDRSAEEVSSEIQRLLEAAVFGSYRSAQTVVELGHFLDAFRASPHEAMRLYEEGEQKALDTLRDAWLGKIRYWNDERTKESLKKALQLGELAERMFPDFTSLHIEIQITRDYAETEGLLPPAEK